MSRQSKHESFWVSKAAIFPDTCICCGMFTDRRVTAKFSGVTTKMVEEKTDSPSGLGCLLFFLGPIGILLSIVMALASSAKKKTTTGSMIAKKTTVKMKMKVPQCPMCQSETKAAPTDGNVDSGELAFLAHNRFIQSYQALNFSPGDNQRFG